jgi:twinkle protein
MISPETIAQIKSVSNIVEIVGQHTKLVNSGKDKKCCCLFHDEKTPSMVANPIKNIVTCFGSCNKSWDCIGFLMDYKKFTFTEALKYLGDFYHISVDDSTPTVKRVYTKPAPRPDNLSQNAINYFGLRGITPETLQAMKVTGCNTYFTNSKANLDAICFNYYKDGELVNIKYRAVEKKDFMLSKDAELIFFNIDSLKNAKSCVIVEGEIDALTVVQCGFKAVISVPNGAQIKGNCEYLDGYIDIFQRMEKVYIYTDNDESGVGLKNELARRIGFEKCLQVSHPPNCKDANEALLKFGKKIVIQAIMEFAIPFPIEGVYSFDDLKYTVKDYYKFGLPKGVGINVKSFDQHLTFVQGHLTTVTGVPGHGKSEFVDYIISQLAILHEWKFGVLSFEVPKAIHVTHLIQKLAGKAFNEAYNQDPNDRIDERELDYYMEHYADYFFFIGMEDIELTIDSILAKATELVIRKGIKGLVIDPYNYIEFQLDGMSETQYISRLLTKIVKFAMKFGVHVFLIAHPTKMPKVNGKYEVPSLYSINGSAHFYNKTYNGFTVYRDFAAIKTEVHIQKVKWFWLGKIGVVDFIYNLNRRQYEAITVTSEQNEPLTQPNSTTNGLKKPKVNSGVPYSMDGFQTKTESYVEEVF